MIGGNCIAQIQKRTVTKDKYGEQIPSWSRVMEITGWLDIQTGMAVYTAYNTKIEDSSHVFVADYVKLPDDVTSENSRFVCDGKIFDITLIDDPMGRHRQLEFFLKYTGGQ